MRTAQNVASCNAARGMGLRFWLLVSLSAAACGGRSGLDAGGPGPFAGGAGGARPTTAVASAGSGGSVSCEPGVLAKGLVNKQSGGAYALAVDETHVYFSLAGDDGAVLRVPKTGGAVEKLASHLQRPRHLSLAGDDVFVTEPMTGTVWRLPKNGAGGGAALATVPSFPEGVAVVGARVFWVTQGGGDPKLLAVASNGGAPAPLLHALHTPWALASQGDTLFVGNDGDGKVGPHIGRYDAQSASYATFPVAFEQNDLAADATWIYWTTNGEVARAHHDGSALDTLAADGAFFDGIAVAGDDVYWTERLMKGSPASGGVGRVWHVNLTTHARRVVAEHLAGPRRVAVDAHCVYWTTEDDGSVMKAAR